MEAPSDNHFQPFTESPDTTRRHRYLPHWSRPGVTFYVTFRTHDSLPKNKLEPLLIERAAWLRDHPKPSSETLRQEYKRRFPQAIEALLDAGHGACHLRQPHIRNIVVQAVRIVGSCAVISC